MTSPRSGFSIWMPSKNVIILDVFNQEPNTGSMKFTAEESLAIRLAEEARIWPISEILNHWAVILECGFDIIELCLCNKEGLGMKNELSRLKSGCNY